MLESQIVVRFVCIADRGLFVAERIVVWYVDLAEIHGIMLIHESGLIKL